MNATITEDMLRCWNSDGYLSVESFFSADEVLLIHAAVDEIASWPDADNRWIHHREETTGGIRLARTENFVPYHAYLGRTLTEGKLVEAIGHLLGEPAVLYKEKINYKYPGGEGYAAHQDAPAYEFVKRHVTCLIAIDRCTPENGCLFFASGLHTRGLIALDERGCIATDVANQMNWRAVPTEPGDVLFFSSYAPHKSPPNATSESRRALYVTYNAATAGDFREAYYRDKLASMAAHRGTGNPEEDRISKIGHFQGKTVIRP